VFGFVNPWLLLFLVAVGIPIAVHLFNFHKFKSVYFTNVSLLKQVIMQTKKQNRIKNWLLLAVRCAFVVLLVLLFASPFVSKDKDTLVQKGKNYVVVCLDNTFSMQNQGSEGRLLDQAKRQAREIAMQYSNSDEFCLLTMDNQSTVEQFCTRQRFLQLIDASGGVQITPQSQADSYLLKKAYSLLQTRNGGAKRCFFISDCQAKSFDVSAFPKDKSIKTLFVPLQAQNINNLFIDSIAFDNPIFKSSEPLTMIAHIVNSSSDDAKGISVKLFVSGKQLAVQSVDVPKNSSLNARISFSLQKQGLNHCRISILDSPITFDDDFYFSLQTDKTITVLEIDGNESQGGNPYFKRLFAHSPEVSFHQWNEQSIDYNSISDYSLVILNELKDFSPSLAMALNKYRQKSGTIVIVPSGDMNVSSFQSSMTLLGLPAYSSQVKQTQRVAQINQENRLYKGVFATKVDNMEMPSVSSYWLLRQNHPVSKESIMRFANAEDFLTVSQKQNSRVYIFSTPLTEKATDFVKQALFVPTLWNMALFAQTMSVPYYYINTLNPIDISFIKDKDFEKVRVVKLSSLEGANTFIPEFINNNERCAVLLHNQAKKAGNYNIVGDGKVYGGLSLNYPRQESVLTFMKPSQIKTQLKANSLDNYNVLETTKQKISSYFVKHDNSFAFWWTILALLLFCIVGETYLLIKKRKNI